MRMPGASGWLRRREDSAVRGFKVANLRLVGAEIAYTSFSLGVLHPSHDVAECRQLRDACSAVAVPHRRHGCGFSAAASRSELLAARPPAPGQALLSVALHGPLVRERSGWRGSELVVSAVEIPATCADCEERPVHAAALGIRVAPRGGALLRPLCRLHADRLGGAAITLATASSLAGAEVRWLDWVSSVQVYDALTRRLIDLPERAAVEGRRPV
jgi:hypothetical protein